MINFDGQFSSLSGPKNISLRVGEKRKISAVIAWI
jgi:hypothetical protein